MQLNKNQRVIDSEYLKDLSELWANDSQDYSVKIKAFMKYVPYTEFPKIFAKYELFKMIENVNGSIIECGVNQGNGLFTWGILSSIFEPVNHTRKIFGFDTFDGFTEINKKDKTDAENNHLYKGGLKYSRYDDMIKAIKYFDKIRPLGHISKIELIKGDASKTIPKFLKNNQHIIVSLLYLDFDIYEPTKEALKAMYDLVPKGGLIVFDQINIKEWSGETIAVKEVLGIKNLRLKRFNYHPQLSYYVKE